MNTQRAILLAIMELRSPSTDMSVTSIASAIQAPRDETMDVIHKLQNMGVLTSRFNGEETVYRPTIVGKRFFEVLRASMEFLANFPDKDFSDIPF